MAVIEGFAWNNFQEYPDYYEVIKKPIDMEKIGHKVKAGQYESLEELISDLVLMFDNACRYNEPDSQIYKVTRLAIDSMFDSVFEIVFSFFCDRRTR